MPIDDGVNWDGEASAASAAYIEVEAASTPKVGIIRVPIAMGDTAEELADRTAREWNDRSPIGGLFALHETGTKLVHFWHPYSEVLRMGLAFKGNPIVDVNVDQRVPSSVGVGIKRVRVDVTIQTGTASAAKNAQVAPTSAAPVDPALQT